MTITSSKLKIHITATNTSAGILCHRKNMISVNVFKLARYVQVRDFLPRKHFCNSCRELSQYVDPHNLPAKYQLIRLGETDL